MGIAKNEKCQSMVKNTLIQKLEIPDDDGLVIQLKSSGGSKYFENIQNAERYYIIYLPDSDATEQISRQEQFHSIHWGIESYHRAKQVCGIERFMVRKTEAIKTHFLVPSELYSTGANASRRTD